MGRQTLESTRYLGPAASTSWLTCYWKLVYKGALVFRMLEVPDSNNTCYAIAMQLLCNCYAIWRVFGMLTLGMTGIRWGTKLRAG